MKQENLSYQEAITAIHEGYMVKLPEWTGYWFSDENGSVKVFTRTGDILNTPNYDHYNMRQDWSITDGKFGFDFAILALKSGKLVTRSGWNGKAMFLFIRPEDELNTGFIIDKVKSLPQALKDFYIKIGDLPSSQPLGFTSVKFGSYICMKDASGSIVNGWLASQTDMLATDWQIFKY